jgi:hypothetical protein
MSKIYRVTMAFAFTEKNGVQRVMRPGDLVGADDTAFKGRPSDWFESVEENVNRTTFRDTPAEAPKADKPAAKPAAVKE